MNAFLHRFIKNKNYIIIAVSIIFLCGFLFGFYAFENTQHNIKDFLKSLFYLNDEKYINHYQLYLIQSILLIIIFTYLSSSYLGYFGILFFVFIKGIQLSFSLLYVLSVMKIDFLLILLLLIESLLEIIFIYVISTMSIYLSIYVMVLTFYIKENFNMKSIINFRLNILIASLVILSLSLALRFYLIPLF